MFKILGGRMKNIYCLCGAKKTPIWGRRICVGLGGASFISEKFI